MNPTTVLWCVPLAQSMKAKAMFLVTIFLTSLVPLAQSNATLPSSPALSFSPMTCGGQTMWDTVADVNNAVLDIVGNETYPAISTASNATNLYIRMLLDESPLQTSTNLKSFSWGLEFDTDGNLSTYEHLIIMNGAGQDTLYIKNNTVTTSPDDPTDSTESTSVTFSNTASWWNVTAANSAFAGSTDYWLTFILPWSTLADHDITRDTTTAYWFGTSTQPANINGDFVCHDGLSNDPVTLQALASDTDSLDPSTRLSYPNAYTAGGAKYVDVTVVNGSSLNINAISTPPSATYGLEFGPNGSINASVATNGAVTITGDGVGSDWVKVFANTTFGTSTVSVNSTFLVTVTDYLAPADHVIDVAEGAEFVHVLPVGDAWINPDVTVEVEGLPTGVTYVPPRTNITQVTESGYYAQCSLTEDGRVFCQGYDNNKALGPDYHLNGHYSSVYASRAPVEVHEPAGLDWTAVGSTFSAFCAANGANDIRCWGDNGVSARTFVNISNLPSDNVTQIVGTTDTFCGLFETGQVNCWGKDPARILTSNSNYAFTTASVAVTWSGSTITELVHLDQSICALSSSGLEYCLGTTINPTTGATEYASADTPSTTSLLSTINSGSSVVDMAQEQNTVCAVLTNGSVACYGDINYAYMRGMGQGAATPASYHEVTFASLPNNTNATAIAAKSVWNDYARQFCALLDTDEIACWGLNRTNTWPYTAPGPTPAAVNVPANTLDLFTTARSGEYGPSQIITSDNLLYNYRATNGSGYLVNKSASYSQYTGSSINYSAEWHGYDLPAHYINGTLTGLGLHRFTVWYNSSTTSQSYDIELNATAPFRFTAPIYEYEIDTYVNQPIDVRDTCVQGDLGQRCDAFFAPEAPRGISLNDYYGWTGSNFQFTGTAQANVINTTFSIVVQQWVDTWEVYHPSDYNSGDLVNIFEEVVTVRPSLRSFGTFPVVANGFPFDANLNRLMPLMTASESFSFEGTVPNFNFTLQVEDRRFDTLGTNNGMVCADGNDGMSCWGRYYTYGSTNPYNGISNQRYFLPNTTTIDDTFSTPIPSRVSGDFDISTVGYGTLGCVMNATSVVRCPTSVQYNSPYTITWEDPYNGATASDKSNAGQCAVLSNGSVACRSVNSDWGLPPSINGISWMPLPSGASAVEVESMSYRNLCAILSNGSIACTVWVPGPGQTGYDHVKLSKFDNGSRILQNGDVELLEMPTGRTAVTFLGMEGRSSCVQLDDDSVYCFGRNLGDLDDQNPSYAPHRTFGTMGAAINMSTYGNEQSCLVDDNHSLWCSGYIYSNYYPTYHMLDTSQRLDSWTSTYQQVDTGGAVVDVEITDRTVCVLYANGTVSCAGVDKTIMGIGEKEIYFGVNQGWTPAFVNFSKILDTPVGLMVYTPATPANYGMSQTLDLYVNTTYGQKDISDSPPISWDGDYSVNYPFKLDYVHAVEFESSTVEIVNTTSFTIPGTTYCTWCTNFTFTPPLPQNWQFNSVTGDITGYASQEFAATTYTLNASAANGSDEVQIEIAVVKDLTVPIIVKSNPYSHIEVLVNQSMTEIDFNDTTGKTSSWSISPSPPTGVYFETLNGTMWGTPAFVEFFPRNYTVTATTAAGMTSTMSFSMQVMSTFTPIDSDNDGLPDDRDPDDDNDGYNDTLDPFPLDPNEWEDTDADGTGDNADTDDDNDGVDDSNDLWPYDGTEWSDNDGDGTGDNADTDDDNDGYLDMLEETCGSSSTDNTSTPTDFDTDGDGDCDAVDLDDDDDGWSDADETTCGSNPLWNLSVPVDFDGDNVCDIMDDDDDNDGVDDVDDDFPYDSNETDDTDGDGVGDNADRFPNDPNESGDRDGDGVGDNGDAFPDDANETVDSDGDGVGDNGDAFPSDANESSDRDGDGVGDNSDLFPDDGNETVDTDGDGVGDNGDFLPFDPSQSADSDGDGCGDNATGTNGDQFPNDSTECPDSDGDGVGDNGDLYPNDANESADSDGDGVGDNADAFPNDASESDDSDGDGVGDNADFLPNDATQTVDADGDGCGDNPEGTNGDRFPSDASECGDADGDGVGDNTDLFPNDADESVDTDGDGYGDNGDFLPNDASQWLDSDGDGCGDNAEGTNGDLFPNDAYDCTDIDGDGIGDRADDDDDNDGVRDTVDAFPYDANETVDTDGDGLGDNADEDDDGDGVSDVDDYDSLNPLVWDEPGFSISFGQYFTTIVGVLFLLVFLTREKDEDEPDA